MHGTIDLPALTRAADLLPATLDEEDRSIEVVWSTGARACAVSRSLENHSTKS